MCVVVAKKNRNNQATSLNPTPMTSKSFTAAEVAPHKSEEDCWIIIGGKVYDVSKL